MPAWRKACGIKHVTLNISGITVEVTKKKIKNMHLYVKPPNGRVTISAPRSMSRAAIERFVLEKEAWIKKQVAKYENSLPEPREYVTGEMLCIWGRQYRLLVEIGSKSLLVLTENTAILTAKSDSTAGQRGRLVREWYRAQLKAETTRLLPLWEKTTGLIASGWQTKYMKTRWGTCNTTTRKIWLNVQLAEKSPECLEYVILHELVHLAEKNHGEKFKALMDRYMPEWRDIKAKLNGRT